MRRTDWKSRLRTVLGKDEFSDIYLKTQVTKGDKTIETGVLSPFVTPVLRYIPEKTHQTPEPETDFSELPLNKILEILTKKGCTFQIFDKGTRFEMFEYIEKLTPKEKEQIEEIKDGLLCQLIINLFARRFTPENGLREQMQFEIEERTAILEADGIEDAEFKAYCQTALYYYQNFYINGSDRPET